MPRGTRRFQTLRTQDFVLGYQRTSLRDWMGECALLAGQLIAATV